MLSFAGINVSTLTSTSAIILHLGWCEKLSPRVVWSPFVSKHCDHTNLIWCELPFELNISISLHLYGIMYLHLNRVSYLYLNRCKCLCLNKCSIVVIYHSFKVLQLFSWEQLWFLSFIWVWVTFIFLVREWLNQKATSSSSKKIQT